MNQILRDPVRIRLEDDSIRSIEYNEQLARSDHILMLNRGMRVDCVRFPCGIPTLGYVPQGTIKSHLLNKGLHLGLITELIRSCTLVTEKYSRVSLVSPSPC